jgi:hypothetical protein
MANGDFARWPPCSTPRPNHTDPTCKATAKAAGPDAMGAVRGGEGDPACGAGSEGVGQGAAGVDELVGPRWEKQAGGGAVAYGGSA